MKSFSTANPILFEVWLKKSPSTCSNIIVVFAKSPEEAAWHGIHEWADEGLDPIHRIFVKPVPNKITEVNNAYDYSVRHLQRMADPLESNTEYIIMYDIGGCRTKVYAKNHDEALTGGANYWWLTDDNAKTRYIFAIDANDYSFIYTTHSDNKEQLYELEQMDDAAKTSWMKNLLAK